MLRNIKINKKQVRKKQKNTNLANKTTITNLNGYK
jgi:hypothetical protein